MKTIQHVIVTGGFGFIGSNICRALRDRNIKVTIIENWGTSVPSWSESFDVRFADITNIEDIMSIKVLEVDALLHLAGQSSGPRSFIEPELDIKLNVIGTLNAIELCKQNKIPEILFASSFVVYGDVDQKSSVTEDTVATPKSVYATSKYACELLLKNYAEPHGIIWKSLRMFNVYGPGQNIERTDQGIVGIFMKMVRDQDTIEVKGSLERYRDLVYIDDVVEAWIAALSYKGGNIALNVCSGHKTTIRDLINRLIKISERKSEPKVIEIDATPGDILGCFGSLAKSASTTGYSPKTQLTDGLANMWKACASGK